MNTELTILIKCSECNETIEGEWGKLNSMDRIDPQPIIIIKPHDCEKNK